MSDLTQMWTKEGRQVFVNDDSLAKAKSLGWTKTKPAKKSADKATDNGNG